jgi:hypothetical protein
MAAALGIAGTFVILTGIAHLATIPTPTALVEVNAASNPPALETPPQPSAEGATVRFSNPFDATEVFEFPPGTTEAEAREAVADLLLQRARDRQNSGSKTARDGKKPADSIERPTAPRLARRN